MKNNLEYYQHFTDSHNHPKFKMLCVKYGWEGEGKLLQESWIASLTKAKYKHINDERENDQQ